MNLLKSEVDYARKYPVSSSLSRDDFDSGPISLDEIEPGLWLGNLAAATDIATIMEQNIKHILTVDSCRLPDTFLDKISGKIQNKYVEISDLAADDLLSQIDDCIAFIESALPEPILVHCFFGVSRSAAVIIAYVMKSYCLNYKDAFQRVKNKRSLVGPNSGFIQQLQLFCLMNWTIDEHHPIYKVYRLRLAGYRIEQNVLRLEDCETLLKPDPALQIPIQSEPIKYHCRSCRRVIATQNNILPHTPCVGTYDPLTSYDTHTGVLVDYRNILDNSTGFASKPSCLQLFFMEPIKWMSGVLDEKHGKLHCPKCKTKIGGFNWDAGIDCPCGTNVKPAFYVIPSKVEHSRVLKR